MHQPGKHTLPSARRHRLRHAAPCAREVPWQCLLWLAATLLSLCGCKVGPNYHPPKISVERRFGELEQRTSVKPAALPSRAISGETPLVDWWRAFKDSELDSLIERAAQQSYDLRVAVERIQQARLQRLITAAALLPQINAGAGYLIARGSETVSLPLGSLVQGGAGSGNGGKVVPRQASGSANSANNGAPPLNVLGSGGLPGQTTSLYQAGFDASWELDVFGGTRRRVEAAVRTLEATLESRRDTLVTLLAEVARDYLELRGTQARLDVARKNLKAEQDILELTRSLWKSGLASDFDTTRAAGELATVEATIPPLESSERQLIHALGILLSEEPNALDAELTNAAPLPDLPIQVPVGLPSELLRRRPDLRRAERQLAAATAAIGAAKAELYPRFLLTGSAGLDTTTVSQWFEWPSHYFLFSPTVSWPIFDAGQLRANLAVTRSSERVALWQYRSAVLSALQEVEDALAAYTTEQARLKALTAAFEQNQVAFDLARSQYKTGLADFLNVLDAERSLLSAQDTLAQSRSLAATDLVALYKALGGGWQNKLPAQTDTQPKKGGKN